MDIDNCDNVKDLIKFFKEEIEESKQYEKDCASTGTYELAAQYQNDIENFEYFISCLEQIKSL